MKISELEFIPLYIPYKKPYYWAQGITSGAEVILIKLTTTGGVIGYGECIATPSSSGIIGFLEQAKKKLINQEIFNSEKILRTVHQYLFQAHGTCSSPRFASQVLSGIEIALWDAKGKTLELPVNQLLGGAQHKFIQYFGFAMGENALEISKDAKKLANSGYDVIYIKVGKENEAEDIEIIKKTREAIGPTCRLRLDPNEHWPILTFRRIVSKISQYNIEFIEQPCDAESLTALSQIHEISPIAIAADQSVFSIYDAFDICKNQTADMLTLGIHETGGISNYAKIANIAKAAGINICIHGLYETGITTCASHQVASTISNLDDGNQIMNSFLEWDIIKKIPNTMTDQRHSINMKPGLGFDIDHDAISRARELHKKHGMA